MANFPEYDLNHLPSRVHLLDRNKAIHHMFDPGSTFKIITASAAIESHKVALEDTFDCSEGLRLIAGKIIRDHHKFEILRFPEIIIHSSNVGATLIGERLGEETLYNMIQSFGFGKKTGIDLPAEEKGIFWPLKKWTTISCASLSIGYEIAVTPIQMLQAINIIANRGIIIPPRIVKIIPQEPEMTSQSSPSFTRAISEKTAAILCDILKKVVDRGTGQKAQIQGYNIAGKTGTAQKLDPLTGGYTSRAHLASFVGFVPIENPLLSMIVIIDEPQDKYYGGDVAAPIFRDIAKLALRYLQSEMKQNSLESMITAKTWRNQK
jgi:cell division protein FtsI (penicillin-binding protein 3)